MRKEVMAGIVQAYKLSEAYREPIWFTLGIFAETKAGALASVEPPVFNIGGKASWTEVAIMMAKKVDPHGQQVLWLLPEEIRQILESFDWTMGDQQQHLNLEVMREALRSGASIIVVFLFDTR